MGIFCFLLKKNKILFHFEKLKKTRFFQKIPGVLFLKKKSFFSTVGITLFGIDDALLETGNDIC